MFPGQAYIHTTDTFIVSMKWDRMYELERLVQGVFFEVLDQLRESAGVDPCLAAVVAGPQSVGVVCLIDEGAAGFKEFLYRRPKLRLVLRPEIPLFPLPLLELSRLGAESLSLAALATLAKQCYILVWIRICDLLGLVLAPTLQIRKGVTGTTPGSQVHLVVNRNGESKTFDVTLGSVPENKVAERCGIRCRIS
jgi:hypothetical protein